MMEIVGGFLSTMFPPTGPAVEQFPATSHTKCVPVKAVAVSVPAGTAVLNVKLPSVEIARPEPASVPAQLMVTSEPCHRPSGAPQPIDGGVLSMRTVSAFAVSTLLALSLPK